MKDYASAHGPESPSDLGRRCAAAWPDYPALLLSRIRERYDRTGDTGDALNLGGRGCWGGPTGICRAGLSGWIKDAPAQDELGSGPGRYR